MILSLKITSFVYENFSYLNHSETISYIIDFGESENEEKKELDENEKIHQFINASNLKLIEHINSNPFTGFSELRNLYFEYITPPPELA
ncbi:MAG: hypothetical protein ACPGTO_07280 [Polaribacter sp.]